MSTNPGQSQALRKDLIEPSTRLHGGRLFKTTGDGFFVAFASSVQALRCAIAIQDALQNQPDALRVRIGVHQGEVVSEEDDFVGDGVIIAARLESLAEPGGICISARVREDAMGKLPLNTEDLGTPLLKHVAQPVRVYRVRREPERHPVLVPDKPSIVILPLNNISDDSEQDYFADGIVEDITTALSRIPSLFVIGRNSAFPVKGRLSTYGKLAVNWGVRYVLEGSVRTAGSRMRVTGQLINAVTGAHLWGDRFEGGREDVFALQDAMTASVAGAIEPRLQEAEIKRAQSKSTQAQCLRLFSSRNGDLQQLASRTSC